MTRRWFCNGVAVCVAGVLSGCTSTRIVSTGSFQTSIQLGAVPAASPLDVLVVADNQQHNVLGGKLRSMSWWTERFVTSVAVRSPAVNLWSHHVLERFVEDAQQDGLKLVLHLGDATDIACSGELDVFVRSMQRATGGSIPWLMAPGNHDSALAGNINSYLSKLPEQAFSDAYGDESFSWSGACATPDGKSEAQTKELLVQAYRQALEAQGITFTAAPPDMPKDDAENCTLSVGQATDAASPLSGMEFQAVHRHCARVGDAEDGYHGNVGSFIAQRLRLPGGATALLIDSSDTGLARATPYGFLMSNPALNGDVSDEQRAAIRYLLGPQGRGPLVVFAHSPWSEMKDGARDFLLEVGATAFFSAHTHLRSAVLLHREGHAERGLLELNVGSIVDWPIQALRASFASPRDATGASPLHVQWRTLGSLEGDQQPAWMARCITDRTHHRGADTYQRYLHADDPMGPLQRTVWTAEQVLLGGAPTPAVQPPAGFDTKATARWGPMAELSARIDRLEALMGADANARDYAICQSYWAAEATRFEASVGERARTKGPASHLASEVSSAVLTPVTPP